VLPIVQAISENLKTAKGNVGEYVKNLVLQKRNTKLKEGMEKLRIFYHLSPSSEELNAVGDATRGMGRDISKVVRRRGPKTKLVAQDMKNFETLCDSLEIKYSRSSSALQDLLEQKKNVFSQK
jgi:hypothetical protein